MLSAGAQATDRLNAEAMEALLRWDIAAVLPDARGQAQDSAPRITQLRGFHLALQLRIPVFFGSMGNHDLEIMDDGRFDRDDAGAVGVVLA
ncbi:MAG: hypothetical protein JWO24_441 [Rhodospirillales bacterium]|nr:hypothetical protein [Rhodospirillales bacterium]